MMVLYCYHTITIDALLQTAAPNAKTVAHAAAKGRAATSGLTEGLTHTGDGALATKRPSLCTTCKL